METPAMAVHTLEDGALDHRGLIEEAQQRSSAQANSVSARATLEKYDHTCTSASVHYYDVQL